ncbi:MAG TPA: hypothetical protein EYP30_09800 [Archaeoglobaceae archaeon]|nr:hypothetical protein [Archaeoglobaceae archaeon]
MVKIDRKLCTITVILILSAGAMVFLMSGYFETEINSKTESIEYSEPVLENSMGATTEENDSGSIIIEQNPTPQATTTLSPPPEPTPTLTSTSIPEITPLFYHFGSGGGGCSTSRRGSDVSDGQSSSENSETPDADADDADPTEQPAKKPTAEPAVEPTGDPDEPDDPEEIPEFSTVIFPVISIIGLLLILRTWGKQN